MLSHLDQRTVLQVLEKAVDASSIAAIVPEDLEIVAHNILWRDTDPTELTVMKLLPSVPATSIEHQYTRITSYGEKRGSGFFGEKSLPPSTNYKPERFTNNIRLLGELSETFILAALEETQQALGTTGNVNIQRTSLRLNLLRKKNRQLLFSDTRTIRDGVAGVRYKGIMQLIEEGTDGTDGESPFGSHVIDLEGQPLTAETLREKVAEAIVLFGFVSCLIMDPFARADFEASFDSAQRLDMPISMKPYVIGQQVHGLQTQSGVVHFHTDNILNPVHHFGKYINELMEGGPTTMATVAEVLNNPAAGAGTKWDAASAGQIYYVVTQMKEEAESLGVRVPAAPGSFLNVQAGDSVTLNMTPGDPSIDGFRIYRGSDADLNQAIGTDAYWIADVANTNLGAATAWEDLNHQRPNTSFAFALNVHGRAQQTMARLTSQGLADTYYTAVEQSADFLMDTADERSTVAVANLGPSVGVLPLAHILAQVDRPLMYTAHSPEVRNPFQNFAFKNIGRA